MKEESCGGVGEEEEKEAGATMERFNNTERVMIDERLSNVNLIRPVLPKEMTNSLRSTTTRRSVKEEYWTIFSKERKVNMKLWSNLRPDWCHKRRWHPHALERGGEEEELLLVL